MTKVDTYREKLKGMDSWDAYLLSESNLPGPRANLELAFAVANEGAEELFLKYAGFAPKDLDSNSSEVFLPVCGVIGLGYLAARGGSKHFDLLRNCASDPRWRVREAVALGLQKYGEAAFKELLELMKKWSRGSLLERRAVVATLCEPGLLRSRGNVVKVIELLDEITASIQKEGDRRSGEFRTLRKALGYGWSVVVAANPEFGKPKLERWIGSKDKDIVWIMKNNLKKKRLIKIDPDWVKAQLSRIEK
jgi:HEAT repeat protein